MTHVTIVGNLTDAPDLRFTAKGDAVANFTIAHTERVKENGEWVDGPKLFLRASIWREAAENAAESLTKGARVIVTGKLRQRSFEKDDGKRTVIELEADEIGPSLRYATAKVIKSGGSRPKPVPADDPWGSPAAGEWGNSADLEPPF